MAEELSVLPSWQDGEIKNTIIKFVADVKNPKNINFVEAKDRIAVFDNDGTLWTEKPCYFQESFIRYSQHQPNCSEKAEKGATSLTVEELIPMDGQVKEGMTVDEYKAEARNFLTTSKHERFDRPYVELTFKPMIELLDYLRQNDFQVYISSGGGIDFIRSFAEDAYSVPPQNVIGSAILTKFELREGKPVLVRINELVKPMNDKKGKPVGIERYIGKRPIMAVGNSDGDLQMLQYTDDHQGHDLMMLVHHDDPDREYQYDEGAECALTEADVRGWSVISMKNDFIKVFGWE
ncbi:HAD family hydrolase [Microseira wollei]|uniref:phosphoserine phosphatase n=1 Tax=Microseira wollei NIES-4236 TaxID=2530354 RepID=A0AAV3XQV2_9CYAN|nr:HAD family hydrolase [Microseira wollei]GET44113.1 putative nonspecific acid phosphatase [Microseira wollei NIES-4236]